MVSEDDLTWSPTIQCMVGVARYARWQIMICVCSILISNHDWTGRNYGWCGSMCISKPQSGQAGPPTMICVCPIIIADHDVLIVNHYRRPWFDRHKSWSGDWPHQNVICSCFSIAADHDCSLKIKVWYYWYARTNYARGPLFFSNICLLWRMHGCTNILLIAWLRTIVTHYGKVNRLFNRSISGGFWWGHLKGAPFVHYLKACNHRPIFDSQLRHERTSTYELLEF